jgi:vanillate O-demethylase monooxygenase subunit
MTTLSRPPLALPSNCSFSPSDFQVLAQYWHPVCLSSELTPQKPLPIILLDEELVLYRTGKQVVAAQDLCIHRGVPISLGWMEGDEIVCPYHGFRYGPDGQCTKVPAQPDAPIPKKLCLQTKLAEEKYGIIWVCLSGEPLLPLPDWPELVDPKLKQLELPGDLWKCSSARHTENFNDVGHLSWIHVGTFGNRNLQVVAPYDVHPIPGGLHFEFDYDRFSIDQRPGEKPLESIHYTYDLTFPFYTRLKISFPDGHNFVICNLPSPRSARQTNVMFRMTRDFDLDGPAETTLQMQKGVLAEDRPIVEAQRPEKLPLDLSEEFHIRSDRFSTLYRKGLVEMGLGQEFSA